MKTRTVELHELGNSKEKEYSVIIKTVGNRGRVIIIISDMICVPVNLSFLIRHLSHSRITSIPLGIFQDLKYLKYL